VNRGSKFAVLLLVCAAVSCSKKKEEAAPGGPVAPPSPAGKPVRPSKLNNKDATANVNRSATILVNHLPSVRTFRKDQRSIVWDAEIYEGKEFTFGSFLYDDFFRSWSEDPTQAYDSSSEAVEKLVYGGNAEVAFLGEDLPVGARVDILVGLLTKRSIHLELYTTGLEANLNLEHTYNPIQAELYICDGHCKTTYTYTFNTMDKTQVEETKGEPSK
jgi:hypothetical protein